MSGSDRADLVRHDKTWMEVPGGFDHDAVAATVVAATGLAFDETKVTQR